MALRSLENACRGSIGIRNNLRGRWIFLLDFATGKQFQLPFEMHRLQFRAGAFNLTNTVRFIATYDAAVVTESASFGNTRGRWC